MELLVEEPLCILDQTGMIYLVEEAPESAGPAVALRLTDRPALQHGGEPRVEPNESAAPRPQPRITKVRLKG